MSTADQRCQSSQEGSPYFGYPVQKQELKKNGHFS